jgi:hypothetical protein
MQNPIVKWGTAHLKATVLAQLTSQSALRISLRKAIGKEVIPDERHAIMMQQVQNTLDLADRTVKGKNLDIIITAKHKESGKEELLRGKYDNISQDRTKLETTGRQILNWFPINFKNFQEWNQYSEQLQESFISKRQVLTA